jgi:hypothetical protein
MVNSVSDDYAQAAETAMGMMMDDPWKRPPHSTTPNRQGDPASNPIFCALGKAVSAWEGVGAAMNAIYYAILDDDQRDELDSVDLNAFGDLRNVHKRAKNLHDRWRLFSKSLSTVETPEVGAIDAELTSALAAVRGWAERRNDLAHGYVSETEAPDYTKDEQPLTKQFALCPSFARPSKWPHAEPEYNYLAKEIEAFARAFRMLDERLERIAAHVEGLRERR